MKNPSKKILVIRLGAIGDVIHTTIIASAIKMKHPDYTVHYLTSVQIRPLIENHPHIDKVYEWDRKKKDSQSHLFEVGMKLMKERYDIVYNLTYSIRNIILGLFTLCPRVIYRKYSNKSWVDDFFLTCKHGIKDVEEPERLYLGTDSNALEKVQNDIKDMPRPYIVLTPGGATNNNRQGRAWDLKNWKKLAEAMLNKYGGTIFLTGSKGERKSHEQLQEISEHIKIFSGTYLLNESSALFSLADIVISGDTGPVHIASAHNVKTLSLLGSTSPDKIKPYGANGHYISADNGCKYCWKKKCKLLKEGMQYTPCMNNITPEMVMKKIEQEQLLP